jgi:hypothetical protein
MVELMADRSQNVGRKQELGVHRCGPVRQSLARRHSENTAACARWHLQPVVEPVRSAHTGAGQPRNPINDAWSDRLDAQLEHQRRRYLYWLRLLLVILNSRDDAEADELGLCDVAHVWSFTAEAIF